MYGDGDSHRHLDGPHALHQCSYGFHSEVQKATQPLAPACPPVVSVRQLKLPPKDRAQVERKTDMLERHDSELRGALAPCTFFANVASTVGRAMSALCFAEAGEVQCSRSPHGPEIRRKRSSTCSIHRLRLRNLGRPQTATLLHLAQCVTGGPKGHAVGVGCMAIGRTAVAPTNRPNGLGAPYRRRP